MPISKAYDQLIKALPKMSEKQLEKALEVERSNLRRTVFISRIVGRLNRLRAQREILKSKIL